MSPDSSSSLKADTLVSSATNDPIRSRFLPGRDIGIVVDIDTGNSTQSTDCQLHKIKPNTVPTSPTATADLTKSMNTLSTSSPSPPSQNQQQPPKEVIFEPLKICLDSEDDSSMDSSHHDDNDVDDDDDGYFFGSTETTQEHQLPLTPSSAPSSLTTTCSATSFEYFHKEPRRGNDGTNRPNTYFKSTCTNSNTNGPIRISTLYSPAKRNHSIHSLLGPSSHSSPQLSSTTASTSNKKAKLKHKQKRGRRSVSLHKSVSVVHIPSRCEYSSNVRQQLWSSSAELFANAARNSVEFASEGWDWRNVIEDEHMLLHQASGELIHPIHVQNAFMPVSPSEDGDDGDVDDSLGLSLIAGLVPNPASGKSKNDLVTELMSSTATSSGTLSTPATVAVTTAIPSSLLQVSVQHPKPVPVGDKAQ